MIFYWHPISCNVCFSFHTLASHYFVYSRHTTDYRDLVTLIYNPTISIHSLARFSLVYARLGHPLSLPPRHLFLGLVTLFMLPIAPKTHSIFNRIDNKSANETIKLCCSNSSARKYRWDQVSVSFYLHAQASQVDTLFRPIPVARLGTLHHFHWPTPFFRSRVLDKLNDWELTRIILPYRLAQNPITAAG